ncbi:MAG: hypothetical protein M1839_008384 [Geoglossum umbratile]|nr:MAG: hypothetical protein M1839_008384 [Geoglossum umbratile]
MAATLGMEVYMDANPSTASLQAATGYLDGEYAPIMAEAMRPESIRPSLKARDPHKTSALLARPGIEGQSAAEGGISGIPASPIDGVEKIGDGRYELFFPLTHLKPLQRTALGVGGSRMLLVRLFLGDGSTPPGFCMHLRPEPDGLAAARRFRRASSKNAGGDRHSYWQAGHASSEPDAHSCDGRANRTTYQLGRTLWRHLRGGVNSLEGSAKYLRLRSITWLVFVCFALRRSNLEVRLADLRHDPTVVDLLLSAVYAAADSGGLTGAAGGRLGLLPGCPIIDANSLTQTLNNLPATATFQNADDLTASLRPLGASSQAFLSWVCTSYRGFLASATGVLEVPSMPGVHQFVLANANPELESGFATQMGSQQPIRAVFHGTSLDRLYLILRQGLLVCSGGPLQRNGAALGPAIYTTEEPMAAWSFAAPSSGWPSSAFRNIRVLLGCELIGDGDGPSAATGTHLISDNSRLMVRYVFLCPPNFSPPVAAHVAPAMLSAFALLRNGSV